MPILVLGLLPILVQLCLAELSYLNVAKDKPVSFGSIAEGVKSSWANDGADNDMLCFKSKESGRKFWEVNLKTPIFLKNIQIKSGNDPKELSLVLIDNSFQETKKSFADKKDCAGNCVFTINQEVLKIRIDKTGQSALHLCEVKAYATSIMAKLAEEGAATSADAVQSTVKLGSRLSYDIFSHFLIISIMVLITKCI